jgi:hypothetical protein
MVNNKVHITFKVLSEVKRNQDEPMMPNAFAYSYILPARVMPGTSLMHKSIMERMSSKKPPGMFLYTGR